LRSLRQEFQPRVAEALNNADKEITALLTPDQQARREKIKVRNWPALRTPHAGKIPIELTPPAR
jgi:hypothetical protein